MAKRKTKEKLEALKALAPPTPEIEPERLAKLKAYFPKADESTLAWFDQELQSFAFRLAALVIREAPEDDQGRAPHTAAQLAIGRALEDHLICFLDGLCEHYLTEIVPDDYEARISEGSGKPSCRRRRWAPSKAKEAKPDVPMPSQGGNHVRLSARILALAASHRYSREHRYHPWGLVGSQ